jgi:hypothetical protein|tara:strand:+ start:4180 stop:4800 length:621 start_codon:yes stop_codon:yes gene_type:complete
MAEQRPLKLRAKDLGDMDVVASCLQDAIIPSNEMIFLEADKRFVLVANRFMWERAPEKMEGLGDHDPDHDGDPDHDHHGDGDHDQDHDGDCGDARPGDASFEDVEAKEVYFRVNCGVSIDKVKSVSRKGFAPGGAPLMLNLLTVATERDRITFYFSNNCALRLEISGLRCRLEDLGEPWPTWSRPQHPQDVPAGDDLPGDASADRQ